MTINEFNIAQSKTGEYKVDQATPDGRQIIRFLRWAGALLIALSATGFMLQSHADFIPAYRYWVCLAIITALCVCGLICNYLLREPTGARIFFALSAAFLPVQVSQAGAMLYAFVSGGHVLKPDFDWMRFSEVHPALIGTDILLTAIFLIAVSYTGFSMLAKRHVKVLMQAAILGNLLLLLPVRDGYSLPLLLLLLFGGLRIVEHRLSHDATMRISEGMAARILIWLPFLILTGRSLLYPLTYPLVIAIAAVIAVAGIADVKRYTRSALAIYAGQWIGTVAALSIWPLTVAHFFGDELNNVSRMIPVALMLFLLSTKVTYSAKNYRSISSVITTGLVFAALANDHSFAPLLALSSGIALIVAGGLSYREKIPFLAGNLCFLGGVLFYCGYVVNAYTAAPWVFSICLGLSVLMLASVLDKKQTLIVKTAGQYWDEVKTWS